jgi:hypothetical protein
MASKLGEILEIEATSYYIKRPTGPTTRADPTQKTNGE